MGFSEEWQVLQNQYDSYEKCSLVIKLFAVLLFILCLAMQVNLFYLAITIMVLWLQDAIWKTFQSRIENRLYVVEAQLALPSATFNNEEKKSEVPAFQFNSEFSATRKTGISLLVEYATQALRPTIAYPYVLLLPLTLLIDFFA